MRMTTSPEDVAIEKGELVATRRRRPSPRKDNDSEADQAI